MKNNISLVAAYDGGTDNMFTPSSEFLSSARFSDPSQTLFEPHQRSLSMATTTTSCSLHNHLDLQEIGLVGRDQERRILEQAYDRVCCRVQQAPSEVVLVDGASGTGKSALVSISLRQCIDREGMGLFVQGKNDIHSSTPYEAVVAAATQLCRTLSSSSGNYYLDDVRQYLQSVLSEEDCRMLLNLIPAARILLSNSEDAATSDDSDAATTADGSSSVCSAPLHEFALKQFLLVFGKFWNSVASVHPVILFLDDLQWADAMSKDFLTALATDMKSTNLLIIGAFRKGEFQCNFLKNEEEDGGAAAAGDCNVHLRISKVHLGPLRQTDVNEIVSRATKRRREETTELGEIVHRKTNGNAFFTLQFLDMLQTSGLLSFSFQTNQWEWETSDIIASRTDVSDNVAELLTQKMTRLSTRAQTVLMVAACLGHTFDETVLETIASSSEDLLFPKTKLQLSCNDSEKEGPNFKQALMESAKAGLIESASSDSNYYKFSHDAIQQAAFHMVPEGVDEDDLRAGLGERVLHLSRTSTRRTKRGGEQGRGISSNMDWMLFSAVDLLTRHSSTMEASKFSRQELAGLCLEACRGALAKSAFTTAATYADRGYALLLLDDTAVAPKRSCWESHYKLCLELCTLSAEMHHSYGDHDGAIRVTSDIVQHGRSIEDKLTAQRVLVAIRLSQKDMHGAIRECLVILKELGVKVPEKMTRLHVLLNLVKVKRMLKRRRASDLLDLPPATDSKMIHACRMLHEIAVPAWISNNEELMLLSCLMTMRLTLIYGVSQYSSVAFASYGVTLSHLGSLDEAYQYGCLALQVQEKYGNRHTLAATLAATHFFLSHLRDPICASLEPLENAYERGMRVGDVSFAGHCLVVRAHLGIHVSMKLDHLETQIRGYCAFLRDYQLDSSLSSILPMFQLVLNLRGNSTNALVLEGEAIENEQVFVAQRQDGDRMPLVYLQNARMVLLVVLDELELADAERQKDPSEGPGTYYTKCCNLFFTSLACLGLARRRRRERKDRKSRYYQSQARRFRTQLDKYVQNGSINCIPFVKLLDAEMSYSRSMPLERTMKLYEDAISAARCGRLCRGLAYEKAGEYLLERGDRYLAKDYLSGAWTEFSDYGALAKLSQMERKYSNICSFKGKEANLSSSRPSSLRKPHSIRHVSASCRG